MQLSANLQEILAMRTIARELVRELNFLEAQDKLTGLSYSEIHTLIELEQRTQLTASDLGELLNLEKSTVSRLIAKLTKNGFVKAIPGQNDKRQKPLELTPGGHTILETVHEQANQSVRRALELLNEENRAQAIDGIGKYARALRRARKGSEFTIRPLEPDDDADLSRVIFDVMDEFDMKGNGFAVLDEEIRSMHKSYAAEGSTYLVVTRNGQIMGGAGIAQLEGAPASICELRKMYLSPQARGCGLGKALVLKCLDAASDYGYQECYLETLSWMNQAQGLYQSLGFSKLSKPLGNTGHFKCDKWFSKKLY